jgi:transcription termination factor NusB
MKELSEDELLTIIQSWENLALVVRHITDHPEHLDALMKQALDDSEPRNWRAAWMVDKIHEKHPELIIPYLPVMTDFVMVTRNAGKKRHLLKLISLHELPENKIGELLNFCIEILTSLSEPIAVRAHAMQVLYNIALKEPDFAPELIELIQQEMEFHGSAGINAKGKNIIKQLRQLMHPFARNERKASKA